MYSVLHVTSNQISLFIFEFLILGFQNTSGLYTFQSLKWKEEEKFICNMTYLNSTFKVFSAKSTFLVIGMNTLYKHVPMVGDKHLIYIPKIT